jgi:ADP-heptose:LPS heptosyltransferase
VPAPKSFLIIQTAFIGDVILATAIVEKLTNHLPDASIDFLVRKGNEVLLVGHPKLRNLLVWEKKKNKIKNLLTTIKQTRANQYDYVINVHRFLSSGLITVFSGAKTTVGFKKNPLSFLFTSRILHEIKDGVHEVDRNQALIAAITDTHAARPALYPSLVDEQSVCTYKGNSSYVCIAPTSVWYTKQWASKKWIELLDILSEKGLRVFLLGAATDELFCNGLIDKTKHRACINLCGKLTLLQSAALMKDAAMNFVNDSAPIHLASAINAPATVIYCSTVPSFGFGPLSDHSVIIQTNEHLSCRPCGLHGFKACPKGHFKCAFSIDARSVSESV